jgi:hypothetical protein
MGHKIWVLAALLLAACSSANGDDSEGAPCRSGDTNCHKPPNPSGPGSGDGSGGSNAIPGGQAQASDTGGNTGSAVRPDASAGGLPGSECADKRVYAARVTPTVILIVDQSGSMNDDFAGDGSRWNVLRDFLLQEPDGLIADLQKQVRFGLALYSARSATDGGSQPEGECPIVTTVPPALDNFSAIADVYRANEPIDDTPTGDSIDKVVEDLHLATDPDTQRNPVVFVLATDGEPDRCEELDPQTDAAKMEAIDAVTRAFMLGIRTFVISVGNEVGADHQQAIANAGLGRKPGDMNAEYWVAGDDQTLRTALTEIVGAQLGCEVTLNGKVDGGDPCEGRVELNGQALECNGADGWQLTDPTHIKLLGSACTQLKSTDEVNLEVSFPCSVPIVD